MHYLGIFNQAVPYFGPFCGTNPESYLILVFSRKYIRSCTLYSKCSFGSNNPRPITTKWIRDHRKPNFRLSDEIFAIPVRSKKYHRPLSSTNINSQELRAPGNLPVNLHMELWVWDKNLCLLPKTLVEKYHLRSCWQKDCF